MENYGGAKHSSAPGYRLVAALSDQPEHSDFGVPVHSGSVSRQPVASSDGAWNRAAPGVAIKPGSSAREDNGAPPPQVSSPHDEPIHNLSYGYVTYMLGENNRKFGHQPGVKKFPSFLFYNNKFAKPIQLYPYQVQNLIKLLPQAYAAYYQGDTTYRAVVANGKSRLVTLEVSFYNDKMYLFMKKFFKPYETRDDPNQDWLYTSSNVQLDPAQDSIRALLKFVLNCSQ